MKQKERRTKAKCSIHQVLFAITRLKVFKK